MRERNLYPFFVFNDNIRLSGAGKCFCQFAVNDCFVDLNVHCSENLLVPWSLENTIVCLLQLSLFWYCFHA